NHQAGDQQRDTKDQADARAFAEGQADYQPGNEQGQADGDAETKSVGTVESSAALWLVSSFFRHDEFLDVIVLVLDVIQSDQTYRKPDRKGGADSIIALPDG